MGTRGWKGRCEFNRLKVVEIDGLLRYAVEGRGYIVGDPSFCYHRI
jgi:hypothetical protein